MANLSIANQLQYFHKAIILQNNYHQPDAPIEELYAAYRDLIYRVALRVTRNRGDAEDVVQDVFLRLILKAAVARRLVA